MKEAASMLRPSKLARERIIEALADKNPNPIQPARHGGQRRGSFVFGKPLNGAALDDDIERTRAHRTV
jgi:hypothetical protein